MKPMIEFYNPQTQKSDKKPKRIYNNSPFNTVLIVILAIIMIYFMVKGFIWAWNTLGAWETL